MQACTLLINQSFADGFDVDIRVSCGKDALPLMLNSALESMMLLFLFLVVGCVLIYVVVSVIAPCLKRAWRHKPEVEEVPPGSAEVTQ